MRGLEGKALVGCDIVCALYPGVPCLGKYACMHFAIYARVGEMMVMIYVMMLCDL